jgi:hypothetical protein
LLLLLVFGLIAPSYTADNGAASPLKLVAYYFHATQRCATCMAIESYSKDALQAKYGDALRKGIIEWRVVDVEQPKNRHFAQDYRLYTSSLVLVKFNNGKQGQWRTLDKTWDLVRKKGEFIQHVQSNVATLLGN